MAIFRTRVKAPSSFQVAAPTSSTTLTCSWTAAPAFSVGNYELEQSLDGSTGWTLVQSPGASVSTTDVSGLSPGTPYYFRLRYIDTQGNYSPYTDVSTGTTLVVATSDLHPRRATIAHGGTRDYTTTTYQGFAARAHINSVNAFRNWESTKSQTLNQAIAATRLRSALARGPRFWNYSVNDIVKIADIGASNANSPWATKANAEKWLLYLVNKTGTPVGHFFDPANYYAANITSFASPDSSGKKPYQWFADWVYSWQVTGDANNSPCPLLSGPYLDSISARNHLTGDWNLDGTTDNADDSLGTGTSGPSSQWIRDAAALYAAYLRTVWGPNVLLYGNIAEWTTLGRVTTGADGIFELGLMESFAGSLNRPEYRSTFTGTFDVYKKCRDALMGPQMVIWHNQDMDMTAGTDPSSTARGDPAWQGIRYLNCMPRLCDAYVANTKNSGYRSEDLAECDEEVCGTAGPEALGAPIDSETTGMTLWRVIRNAAGTNENIYRRRFANGTVYVRPRVATTGAGAAVVSDLTISAADFGGTKYRLRGIKETTVNNHLPATSHTFTRDRDAVIYMNSPT